MDKKTIKILFQRFQQQNPHPTTELRFQSPFELLVAVILSAQATDVSVNKATEKLFPIANTPEKIFSLGIHGLIPYIKTIGLFNSKAKHIIAMCQQLITLHQSQVPHTREALEALPGVGRKTANVVLNTAFGEPTMAVDTHIFRVANRLQLAPGKTPLQVEHGLLKNIDKEFLPNAHHWLILHGRYVCKAQKRRCAICIVRDLCPYPNKTDDL